MKRAYTIKQQPILNIYFLDINAVFARVYSAQHCLLALIEKWGKVVDDGGVFGALLTDLSKAFDYMMIFDCIHH